MNNDMKLTDLLKATAKHSVRQIKIKYARTKKQWCFGYPARWRDRLEAINNLPLKPLCLLKEMTLIAES
ncbi:MAG: hypothetical protein BGP14_23525 [Sphingobacteriales bacterium 44-15]|nr:MAG: hypothetical protein BGP14_23525 [Sphingobacteriales bacterium 44-15]